jgi:stringent starvation protein B
MYQWIVDNGMTPHLLANVSVEGCLVPPSYIQDGKIVLNIAPMAITGLVLGDDDVSFGARFNGVSESIYVPIRAIEAIYARENGQGMMFSDDDESLSDMESETFAAEKKAEPESEKPKRPSLRLVK